MVGGHNLETIKVKDSYIILYGEDIIQTIYGIKKDYCYWNYGVNAKK